MVTDDRPYIQVNDRERERLREFINRLDDDALAAPANEYWTVGGVLGHMAYWDIRVLVLDFIDAFFRVSCFINNINIGIVLQKLF
jgi:hypothetical protein